MLSEENSPAAADLLSAAGWRPHSEWGVFTRGTLVMGFDPHGVGFHVKDYARVRPGAPLHSADTPDTPEEAAAWLVARFAAAKIAASPAPQPSEVTNSAAADAGDEIPPQPLQEGFQPAAGLDDTNPPPAVPEPIRAGPLPPSGARHDEPLAPAYPGVMVLPDEIGAARNAVVFAITLSEKDRLTAACDPSRWQTLSQTWQDVHNADVLGVPVTPQQRFAAGEFVALRSRAEAIRAHADALRDAALAANGDMLKAMHKSLGDGWP